MYRKINRVKQFYGNEPHIIKARFNSTCAETGKAIKKGTECLYFPVGKKVFGLDTKEASRFREQQFDEKILGYS